MPTYLQNGYIVGLTAGTQVSSTGEGRHLRLLDSTLTHPSHSDAFTDKGDPVVVATGDIVGVAFNSSTAATDYVNIDTEGIWNLSVTGTHSDGTADGANNAVVIGDFLYINISDGTITKEHDPVTHKFFGFALGPVSAGSTTVIAVKVHGQPDVFSKINVGTFPSAGVNPVTIDVSAFGDGGRNDPAWLRAYVTSSSVIEGDEELRGIYIRMSNSTAADAGTVTGGEFKCIQDATNTTQLAQVVGLKANVDLRGLGAIHQTGIEILMEGAGTASDNRQGIRFIGRDTAGTLESLFAIETATTLGSVASDTLATPSGTLAVNVDGVIHHLQLYST